MNISSIIFYIISAFILVNAVLAVTARKIFRSSIWLLFSLTAIAALYFWMDVNFIAAVQIVVYVGGIVVLIIFSIFLTQKAGNEMPKPLIKRTVLSIAAVLLGIAFVFIQINLYNFKTSSSALNTDVEIIGTQLLGTTEYGYSLPFEAVSILLLAAMIGCIVIAIKEKNEELVER
jgi:NADH-quinone oxidoreductase subunit J